MQTLDIISVNLWQILISLGNLFIIFIILKKVLYKPVKNVLAQRQAAIDEQYAAADEAVEQANADKAEWEQKMQNAKSEADSILQSATATATKRGERIISEAKEKADGIIRQAEIEAGLERQRATDGIKREIVEVSGVLAEKMLEREINADDHRNLIDSFIEKIGDGNDADR